MTHTQYKVSRAEYWLLDVVIDHAEPMHALLPVGDVQDYFAGMFNREPLGLDANALLNTLSKMVDDGYIFGQWFYSMPFRAIGDEFMPSRQEISAALTKPRQQRQAGDQGTLYFKLSLKGGEVWESLSNPDWMLFVTREEAQGLTFQEAFAAIKGTPPSDQDISPIQNTFKSDDEDANRERLHIQLTSANSGLVLNYFALDNDYYNIVVPNTRQWQELSPWQATYWKTLPQGYELAYTIYSNIELQKRKGYILSHSDLDQQSNRLMPYWYTNHINGQRSN